MTNSYYMVIIVRTLWLAAERALFSYNDRWLWNIFSAQQLFWVVSKTMKVYERVGENDKKEGQSTTIISITERKTTFQKLLKYEHSRPQRPRSFGQHLEPRPLARSTPEVSNSRISRHSAYAQSQDWQISLVLVSKYCFTKHSKPECRWTWSEVAILGAECWPKGARPLGTRT